MKEGNIDHYTMGGMMVECHMVFADIIFFCRSSKTFKALKGVLEDFSTFSRLSIKYTKSFIVYSARVQDKEEMSSILGFL